MDQIRANTPAPIKANLMTELLSVQMSWGNRGCTRAGSPGPADTRLRAMGRAVLSGDDVGERVGPWWVELLGAFEMEAILCLTAIHISKILFETKLLDTWYFF